MSKRKRILMGIGIAIVTISVYLYFFGEQTAFGLMERYKCRKIPVAWETPVPLGDLSIASNSHRKASFCGYEFELPWDDVDEQKTETVGSMQVIAFRSRNAFRFSCYPPRDFVSAVIKDMNLDPKAFRGAYGDAAFESDYDFHRVILSVTPHAITLFTPDPEVRRDSVLLFIKAIAMPTTDSGIFMVQTPEFRGFQFGAPQRWPYRITDELFSDQGGIDLTFFQDQHGSAPALSQAEINRVVQSVRKVADAKGL